MPEFERTVDAVKLWKAYDANEVAADDEFKGKTVLVTGRVLSIDKDFLDNIVVRLSSPNEFMPTSASMRDSEKAIAAGLQNGTTVHVVCECAGRLMGSPTLRDCVFHRQ